MNRFEINCESINRRDQDLRFLGFLLPTITVQSWSVISLFSSLLSRETETVLFINQDSWSEAGLHNKQGARQRLLDGISPTPKEKLEVDIQTPNVTADDKDKNYNDVEDEEEEQTEKRRHVTRLKSRKDSPD